MSTREPMLTIAALGDLHCRPSAPWRPSPSDVAALATADLVLLAGDVTDTGLPADAAQGVAHVVAATRAPVCAVLGNHDHQTGRADELAAELRAAGCLVLAPGAVILTIGAVRVGVAGTKGMWGSGWPGRPVGLDGETELAVLRAALRREVSGLACALNQLKDADIRIAMLHYSPTMATLNGEPDYVLPFLGAAALGVPILASGADLVVHGHSHRGRPVGRIGPVPVRNVALPANGGAVSLFQVSVAACVDSGRLGAEFRNMATMKEIQR